MEIKGIKILVRKNKGNYEHEEAALEAVLDRGEDATQALNDLRNVAYGVLHIPTVAGDTYKGLSIAGAPKSDTIDGQDVPLPIPGEAKAKAERQSGKGTSRKAAPSTPTETTKTESPSTSATATDSPEEMEVVESPYKAEGKQASAPVTDATTTTATSTAQKPGGKPPKGVTLYSKGITEHRSRVAAFLSTEHPNWKYKDGKNEKGQDKWVPIKGILDFTAGLDGTPFEDNKGNMLPEFKQKIAGFFATVK